MADLLMEIITAMDIRLIPGFCSLFLLVSALFLPNLLGRKATFGNRRPEAKSNK